LSGRKPGTINETSWKFSLRKSFSPPRVILLLRWVTHKPRFDLVLVLALLLAVLFCLHGIRWGRVECWNRDQMALRALAGLRPGDYSKPPFHTYLNHLLIIEPIKLPLRIAHVPRERQNQVNGAVLLGSRLLTLALYLGTILFAYAISLRCYGQVAAQIIALLFATSAGFVAFAHFLTVDLPVLFWMMAAFFFGTQVVFRGKTFDYVCCGYLTGIATATKYNGLAVGLVLVVAHVLASKRSGWQKLVFSRQLFLGLLMVPIGFIAGNPYGVLRDWNRFRTDFLFNYIVTPRYEGQPDRVNYVGFLQQIPEIIGFPGVIAVVLCILIAIIVVLGRRDLNDPATRGFILAGAVFLFYFLKMGAFPRQPVRFVLPAVPFLLLAMGPALPKAAFKKWPWLLLGLVLIYNCICAWTVGQRFNNDPRLPAQLWLLQNVRPGNVIESSPGSPHWSLLPELGAKEVEVNQPDWEHALGAAVIDLRMPALTGRADLFRRIFPNEKWVGQFAAEHESDSGVWAYREEELSRRHPDFVTLYSSDLFSPNQALRKYYNDVLAHRDPYEIAFNGQSPAVSPWIYPRSIDFLAGRMVIFRRKG
jgi:Dolichyl-phosphate-mannose-protein mannosyltransferase